MVVSKILISLLEKTMLPRVPIWCSRQLKYYTVIYAPFLPSVLRHAWFSIRGTPVGLPRFRSMR